MAGVQTFLLPDVGEGLTEADIVEWHVRVGDTIAINDVLVEIETAKSIVELPSPFAGVVTAIHRREGETVEVGTPIVTFGCGTDPTAPDADNTAPDADNTAPDAGNTAPDVGLPDAQPVLVGYGPTRTAVARRPRRTRPAADRGPVVDRGPAVDPGPVVDVEPPAPGTTTTGGPGDVRIPIKGVRKHTAEAMVTSAFTAPHVTEWVTVDVTRTLKLLDRMRLDKGYAGVRLSPLLLIIRAVLISLRRHPAANAKWDGGAGEIVQLRDVNLGIAAATPRGLLVPNIAASQSLSTIELATALADLVAEARAGKTPPERMRGGTFTITNVGVFGVDGGTPILNPGEAAILCVGQIRRRPWEHKGRVKLRSTITLSLSFDHRLIDGELGSQVLADIGRVLEHPSVALSW